MQKVVLVKPPAGLATGAVPAGGVPVDAVIGQDRYPRKP